MAEGASDNGSACLETDVTGMFSNCSKLIFLSSAGEGVISFVSAANPLTTMLSASIAPIPAPHPKPQLSTLLLVLALVQPRSMLAIGPRLLAVGCWMLDVPGLLLPLRFLRLPRHSLRATAGFLL
jgi:hypothetical protein